MRAMRLASIGFLVSSGRLSVLLLAAVALFMHAPVTVVQADQNAQGQLRLTSPFAGSVSHVATNENEDIVAVANAYKSVAVWQLPDEQSLQTLRVPLRSEQNHRTHALAMSPDGSLIAYSVPPVLNSSGEPQLGSSRIYVIRRDTGVITKTISAIATRVQAIRFSPDGRVLAAVLSGGCGLRLWTLADGAELARDDRGYGGRDMDTDRCCRETNIENCDDRPATAAVLFSKQPEARFSLMTSGDTGLKTYNLKDGELQRLATVTPKALGLGRPADVVEVSSQVVLVADKLCRVDPNAERRDDDEHRACLRNDQTVRFPLAAVDASTLSAVRSPLFIPDDAIAQPELLDPTKNPGIRQYSLDQLAVLNSADADGYIFASGVLPCGAVRKDLLLSQPTSVRENCIVRWPLAVVHEPEAVANEPNAKTEIRPRFIPIGADRVTDMKALAVRRGLLVASHRHLSLLDSQGQLARSATGATFSVGNRNADFRGGDSQFLVSRDGRTVVFEDYRAELSRPLRVRFDLPKLAVSAGVSSDPNLRAPDQDHAIVRRWRNTKGQPPVFLNRELKDEFIRKNEIFRSVAVLRDAKIALLGSSEALRIVDYGGSTPRVMCRLPVAQEAFRVNLTPDGRFAVVGHSDGTIRWYRVQSQYGGPAGRAACRLQLVLSVHLALNKPDDWRDWVYYAHRPSGVFALDPRASGQLEWVATNRFGQMDVTPLTRLTEWQDHVGIRTALDFLPRSSLAKSQFLDAPNAETLERRKLRERVLYILADPPNREVQDPLVKFRIGVDTERSNWPRDLQVRLVDGRRLAKHVGGRRYKSSETVQITETEVFELGIELPDAARLRKGETGICLYLDDVFQACHTMEWVGPTVKRLKRRLRAVLIGVAGYDVPRFRLPFADNDAIDLAHLFAGDYHRRVLKSSATTDTTGNTSGTETEGLLAVDFDQVEINLIVEPFASSGRLELDPELARHVRVRNATKAAVTQALKEIIVDSPDGEDTNDFFLFYFSGHGFVHSGGPEIGRTALAMPGILPDASYENIVANALTSGELLKLFNQIPGQKLIVIDACRTSGTPRGLVAFDPSVAHSEFADNVLSADFLFASQPGQASKYTRDFAFDQSRGRAAGNSVFTYAMLKGLTDPAALPFGHLGTDEQVVRVEVPDLATSVAQFFRTSKFRDVQKPVFVSARRNYATRVVRSYLKPKPATPSEPSNEDSDNQDGED